MTYWMVVSLYFFFGQIDRVPIESFVSFVIGANEMSLLDMVSGI